MTQLRQQSKLRERLIQEIQDVDEQLQCAYYDMDRLLYEGVQLSQQEGTYGAQAPVRMKLEGDIEAKKDEIVELKEQLALAIHELEDFDETTRGQIMR